MCLVEVRYMSQNKLLAFHVEANSTKELASAVKEGLAELEKTAVTGGAAPEGKGKKEAKSDVPKATLDGVKNALTALRKAIGGDDDEEKKGLKAIKAVLKKFGVTVSTDLKEDQYGPVMKAIEAAMPKEEEGDGEEF